jgi:hypothetical protein
MLFIRFVLLVFGCVVLLLLATQVTNVEVKPLAQARRVRCVALDPYKTMGVSRVSRKIVIVKYKTKYFDL